MGGNREKMKICQTVIVSMILGLSKISGMLQSAGRMRRNLQTRWWGVCVLYERVERLRRTCYCCTVSPAGCFFGVFFCVWRGLQRQRATLTWCAYFLCHISEAFLRNCQQFVFVSSRTKCSGSSQRLVKDDDDVCKDVQVSCSRRLDLLEGAPQISPPNYGTIGSCF